MFTKEVSETLREVCLSFGPAYEIYFIEIGIDEEHSHFLIQSVPSVRISDMEKKIKSITAREIFKRHPEVKKELWGGKFWTQGYYVDTVGQYGNLKMIHNYVKNQGIPNYEQLYVGQLDLFNEVTDD